MRPTLIPVCAAPPDVDKFLQNHGWYHTGLSDHYSNPDSEINNYDFTWPEALAYQMFKVFTLSD